MVNGSSVYQNINISVVMFITPLIDVCQCDCEHAQRPDMHVMKVSRITSFCLYKVGPILLSTINHNRIRDSAHSRGWDSWPR